MGLFFTCGKHRFGSADFHHDTQTDPHLIQEHFVWQPLAPDYRRPFIGMDILALD
jgi:hypothetical protein